MQIDRLGKLLEFLKNEPNEWVQRSGVPWLSRKMGRGGKKNWKNLSFLKGKIVKNWRKFALNGSEAKNSQKTRKIPTKRNSGLRC